LTKNIHFPDEKLHTCWCTNTTVQN